MSAGGAYGALPKAARRTGGKLKMAEEEEPVVMAGRSLAFSGAGEVSMVAERLLLVTAGETETAGASFKLNFALNFANSLAIDSISQM